MMAGLIAFFEALPPLLQILSQLGVSLARLVAYAQQNNLNQWLANLESIIDELENAKTPDDKAKAAGKLASLIRGLGPK